jgi:hypothetical protein
MRRRSLLALILGLCSWLALIIIALAFLMRWRSEAGRRDGRPAR